MKMKFMYGLLLLICFSSFALQSCTPKLPPEAVSLMQQLSDEGARMHKLNLAFVNKIFTEKQAAVNVFIEEDYLPRLVENTKKEIKRSGQEIDMNEEWPSLVKKLSSVSGAVKDSLQKALAGSRDKIVSKLNSDYAVYRQACNAELNVLSSAVKLNDANRQVYSTLTKKLSGNMLDTEKIETALDGFLKKGSGAADMILGLQNNLDNIF